jgi:negative regulator of sigma-B (phosphoserine phosphatase)
MSAMTQQRLQAIEWSVASRTMPGQSVSGDLYAVIPTAAGAMMGVVDGLGHGEEATAAARTAIGVLEQRAEEPVVPLFQHCHRALQQTRGVVMTIVAVNARDHTLSALGVGNVETVIVRADPQARARRETILLRCGVIGYQLPTLHASVLPVAPGDVIVFATDGVREDFSELVTAAETPASMAQKILTKKFRGTDDGLVLACKYRGKP